MRTKHFNTMEYHLITLGMTALCATEAYRNLFKIYNQQTW